jgi:hypothetical protein
MRFLYLLILIFIPLISQAESKFGSFIDEQIEMVHIINDDNATQEIIMEVAKVQEALYSKALDNIYNFIFY